MRTLSFILALVLLLAPSLSGAGNSGLPGIGTFAYNGSSVNMTAPRLLVANAGQGQ